MTLNRGLIAIATNILLAISTLIAMPLLIRKLGPEGFAFFGLLLTGQNLAQLIESGMSVTTIREVVENSLEPNLTYLHSSYIRFFLFSFLGVLVFVVSSTFTWNISLTGTLKYASLIALIIALRIYINFYRSQLYGKLKHNVINIELLIAHLFRFWVPIYFAFNLDDLLVLFLLVFGLELLFYLLYINYMTDYTPLMNGKKQISILRREYSRNVAIITILGVSLANVDKILFPYFLEQSIYGSYHGVYFIVSGALLIIAPYNALFQPILMKSVDNENFGKDFRDFALPILYGYLIIILLASLVGELIQELLLDTIVFNYNIVREISIYGFSLQLFGILFMYSIVKSDFRQYIWLASVVLIFSLFCALGCYYLDWLDVLDIIWINPMVIGLSFVVSIARVHGKNLLLRGVREHYIILFLILSSFLGNDILLVCSLFIACTYFVIVVKRSIKLI